MDASANVTERDSYDPWGRRRNIDGSTNPTCSIVSQTTRGFTNQEEMDSVCLVNLNARIYDPTIGKFLSADPVIGDSYVGQEWNHYAYVINNPLSLTDPTGLCFLGCFWKSPIFRDVAALALVAILQQYEILPAIGAELGFVTTSATMAAVVNGGILGGIAGAITSGTLKGAALGVLQGGLFAEAGNLLGGADGFTIAGSHDLAAFVLHGLVGGITNAAAGQKFGAGFLAGGFSSIADMSDLSFENEAADLVEHAAAGGLGSVLGGGKFANGAMTGAFGYLFNSVAHAIAGTQANYALGDYLNERDGGIWKINSSFWGVLLDGRADLIDTVTHEVYEIKTNACFSSGSCLDDARTQVQGYIKDAWDNSGVNLKLGSAWTVFRGDPDITVEDRSVLGVRTDYSFNPFERGLIGYDRIVSNTWEQQVLRALAGRKSPSGIGTPSSSVPAWELP